MWTNLREPVSGLTHLAGAFVSLIGSVILIYGSVNQATVWHVVSFSVFGASLLLLYTASALYHLLPLSSRGTAILRRVDHCMIFILIAGTYTPMCLVALRGFWGWLLLGIIWSVAVVGIVLKLVWFHAPRWLYTLFYVLMGLIVVGFFPVLLNYVPLAAIGWIAAGGVSYIIGAVIYGTKLPVFNFSEGFGFHEVFHLFVLGGSACHFWFMYRYLLYP